LGAVVLIVSSRDWRNCFGEKGLIMFVNQFLMLAAILFCIGVYGVIVRKNAVLVLMSIELILNSVNINLIAFSLRNGSADGHTFALYVIAVAAAEVGVGLAMVLLMYRNRRSVGLDELSGMKG
jgi:NADH:ubiquinone oxidoreductase subunit K